jgi:antitoxin component YwqK of YwqJK toxin-antitoxin module
MAMHRHSLPLWASLFALGISGILSAQREQGLLAHDALLLQPHAMAEPALGIADYEPFNHVLGGDSLRTCNGYACNGWLDDKYPGGGTKHRGYYKDGELVIYSNYRPDGTIEREFKALDHMHSLRRTVHPDGTLRSETRYANGAVMQRTDHFPSGRLREVEVRHAGGHYMERHERFAADGTPISSFRLVDVRREEFETINYHPDGRPRTTGRSRFNREQGRILRHGIWTTFDADGNVVGQERYADGVLIFAR